ncbi:MAG TPA: hypothetical protein VHE78_02010, partial [Gemmatimonadaceae bacterium]|nr:hypothetical protein [Gemmatimonadaceae bacterium]
MTRRKRIALFSLGLVIALALLVAGGAVLLVHTPWGHERARRFLVAQVEAFLGGRGHLYLGRLDFTLGGHVSVDSVAILDDHGQVIAAASHIDLDGSLPGALASNIRLTRLLIVRPYLYLELKDSVWNAQRLFATQTKGAPPSQSNLAIAIDSGEVRDGHIVLVMPDSLPRLPPVRRDFSHIELVAGPAKLRSRGATGGLAPIARLAVESSRPPVTLRQAAGAVRWWADSLALDLPLFRLPGSRASVKGSIAWAKTGPAILELLLHADSISLADIAWITPMIPKRGDASARVHIHNSATPHDVQYAVTDLD